jgi:hypothetical protein
MAPPGAGPVAESSRSGLKVFATRRERAKYENQIANRQVSKKVDTACPIWDDSTRFRARRAVQEEPRRQPN